MPRKILVVDGDGSVLASLQTLLRNLGFNVFASDHGKKALQICERERPDLIISDIYAPGLTGYEFLESLKKLNLGKRGKIPVIILSLHGKMRSFFDGWDIYGFLAKPYQEQELIQKVMEAIGPAAEKTEALIEAYSKRKKVLLCGPNDFMIQKVTDFLRVQGHTVSRAYDESDALDIAQRTLPDFVFNQCVDGTSAVDSHELLRGLANIGPLKNILFAVFCHEYMKEEAEKNVPKPHPVFVYKDSPELIRQVREYMGKHSEDKNL